ncbi:MAG TPA: universal stress protein [Desulfuromonadales bacterium]|nr:universal stress protein [Desulfuromonadales bacterium]
MPMRILVPVDGSTTTDRTLSALIGRKEIPSARLTLLHVVNLDRLAYRMIPDFQVEMVRDHARRSGEELLAAHLKRLVDAGIVAEERLEFGSPREVICRIANEEGFELLVIGRRGIGEIRDVLFGSVANHVLHHVRSPVLLI